MTRQALLDLYFMDARSKLLDLAAFLDRMQLAEGVADFRFDAFQRALGELKGAAPSRAREILRSLSDPTTAPAETAATQGATGAWAGGK